MIKKLIGILLISNCSLLYAQTVKTDVLVIGGSPSGVAAAIQCARSKVKTILAVQGTSFGGFEGKGMSTVETNRNTPSGIWGEFRKHILDFYKNALGYDTTYNAPLKFEADTARHILEKMADTTQSLKQAIPHYRQWPVENAEEFVSAIQSEFALPVCWLSNGQTREAKRELDFVSGRIPR